MELPDKSLNFAIIGCGRVAPRHASAIEELDGSKLIAVCDVIDSRANRMGKDYTAEIHSDYSTVLKRKDIHVVNICTPSGLHAQMAIDAMKSKKHVVVEKPMALSLQDADRMIETSRVEGVKLCVVLQNRFNPPMQDMRRVVDTGKLGRLLLGNATVRWYRPQEYYDDSWHGTLSMDGGALMNQSIHHIDALQWLMGDVESVFAFSATLAHRMEAEDTGVAVLRFRNGALGSIEGSTITYPENIEGSVSLFGERGSVKVGGTALNRKIFWKIKSEIEHEREILTAEKLDPPSVYGYSHKTVIADMVEAIRMDRKPSTNGTEARKSLAIVLAFYESVRKGEPINMMKDPWNHAKGK